MLILFSVGIIQARIYSCKLARFIEAFNKTLSLRSVLLSRVEASVDEATLLFA